MGLAERLELSSAHYGCAVLAAERHQHKIWRSVGESNTRSMLCRHPPDRSDNGPLERSMGLEPMYQRWQRRILATR